MKPQFELDKLGRIVSILAGGKIDVNPLISCSLLLGEWKEAFDLLEQLETMKILLVAELGII